MLACLALGLLTTASKPTIIQIIGDDCGYNDFGYQNGGLTLTPEIDALVASGLRLDTYYTYKVCSPSRASILTGRYPFGVGYYDMHGPEVVPMGFKLTGELLQDAGYTTSAIGKWNLGNVLKPYTPTRRGFDTFFGYYSACQVDYWYHGAGPQECGVNALGDLITDFSNSTTAEIIAADGPGINGTYNQELFTSEAVRLIALAAGEAKPIYLYLAYMNVHGASDTALTLQAPEATVALYNRTTTDLYKTAGAMYTQLDEGVGRVVAALKAAGVYSNSVVTFACDNGGPLDHATNFPLRGGKHTLWDGGLRVSAWVHSPLLPASTKGATWDGMMHASDWLPTFVTLAGLNATAVAVGPRPLDGHPMWEAWSNAPGAASPRTEVVHQVVNSYCDANASKPGNVAPFGPTIRVGDFKLIGGRPGDSRVLRWPTPGAEAVPFGLTGGQKETGTDHLRVGAPSAGSNNSVVCDPWCLFDIKHDPSESHDLAKDSLYSSTVAKLAARIKELGDAGPPWAWPLTGTVREGVENANCAVAVKTGFYEPVLEHVMPTPPPTPPRPANTTTVKFSRGGLCLSVESGGGYTVLMRDCDRGLGVGWKVGDTVRGLPVLIAADVTDKSGDPECLAIGVDPTTMKCVPGRRHTPHTRACSFDAAGTKKGGNPVGTGFQLEDGIIKALSCVDKPVPGTCLGVAVNSTALAIVPCTDDSAKGWSLR